MKRRFLVLGLSVMMAYSVCAQKDSRISNGFSINLISGFVPDKYGDSDNDFFKLTPDMQYGNSWGLQLGNRWYFSPKESYGFGLMVNWIDFSAAFKAGTESGDDWSRASIDMSFFEIGPVATLAIGEKTALDGYYNLRPTGFGSSMVVSDGSDDETIVYAGFGLTHALGAAFRYGKLNLGLEYVIGKIRAEGTYDGSASFDPEPLDLNAGHLRLMVGLKF